MKELNITLTEVKSYRATVACSEDDTELVYTGQALMVNPPLYVHICSTCGAEFRLGNTYPRIEWQ